MHVHTEDIYIFLFFSFLSETVGSHGTFEPLKKLLNFLSKAAAPSYVPIS